MEKRKNLLPHYLRGLCNGTYTLKQASESTGYTIRRLSQLKKAYLIEGLSVLEHKNKYKIPANKKKEALKDKILLLYASEIYKDCNFKYFCQCLNKYEKIKISLTTLRVIMKEAGIKSPEAHKIKKPKLHRIRIRRSNFGDLLQLDGTPFPWFYKFGDNKKYCMCGAIDDATSKPTALYITENECLYNYAEILKQTINNYGIPREVYTDRAAIFCVTPKSKQNLTVWEQLAGIHDKKTQWQRILDELSINQILAWSPEAKGRIERLWRTLQGRLPTEFYIHGIDSVEKANEFLKNYVLEYQEEFAVEPYKKESFFREYDIKNKNLEDILCARIPRKTDSQGCFKFHSYHFRVEGAALTRCRLMDLCISERGIFAQFYGDSNYYPAILQEEAILSGLGEKMPKVVEDIIYRYMFAYQKEISA